MDPEHNPPSHDLITPTPTPYYRWPHRGKISLRRRKLPSVRLGGGKRPRRGLFLVRRFRRARLRWLRLKHWCTFKKLKQYYRNLVKDIVEASATIEAVQQRILLETSFAIPVMGMSLTSFPNAYGMDRPY
ncbi:Receptor-type tyrosine-protein like [Actinidia chinensis var. chinensis]|uniref:Receptor-type tyrosine-protein like n=1 Tax=Actinidia chinensis var. chinensis TaxID=1590841 RepID=A0A2R6PSY7_ACTCC|nr:Receptor-type tyrosine-protein like [Actinidia chinensis var. chinensis]